jgi:hypothetical protein
MEHKETIEEAAERMWNDPNEELTSKSSFIKGAKWQQEQDKNKYSKEDCYNTIHNLMTDIKLNGLVINEDIDLKKSFEQFKKQNDEQ